MHTARSLTRILSYSMHTPNHACSPPTMHDPPPTIHAPLQSCMSPSNHTCPPPTLQALPPTTHAPPPTTHTPPNHACPPTIHAPQPYMPPNHTHPPPTTHAPSLQPCMPPPLWTEWHTLVKILPCPKLRLRAVKIKNEPRIELRFLVLFHNYLFYF